MSQQRPQSDAPRNFFKTLTDPIRRYADRFRQATPPPMTGGGRDDVFRPYYDLVEQVSARKDGFLVQTSDELLRHAQKSLSFNRYVQDFINDSGNESRQYDSNLIANAYRTSIYLSSFMRRAADMLSTLKVVAEVKKGETWRYAPPSEPINQIFAEQGSDILSNGYMYYALYGRALWYMHKTVKAVMAERQTGRDDAHLYKNHGLAGFHAINTAFISLDIDFMYNRIQGFMVTDNQPGMGANAMSLRRNEAIFFSDFDPLYEFEGTSIAVRGIHNAVTNAAIAKWASHYFTTGAMPLILVSMQDDPTIQAQADIEKTKQFFENQWSGTGASVRSVFTDRKLEVQQVGIDADKVAAPELDRTALNGLGAAVGLAPDLVIPPEGGSDNARHKHLIFQAWTDTIIPLGKKMLSAFNRDAGFPEGMRLTINEDEIPALDADRGETADTEVQVFQSGLQYANEARARMRMKPIPELKNTLYVNGQLMSVERWLREQTLLDKDLLASLITAWDSNMLTLRQIHETLNLPIPRHLKLRDGYKHELVPTEGGGGFGGFGGGNDTPPSPPSPPTLPGAPTPKLPGGSGLRPALPAGDEPDGEFDDDSDDGMKDMDGEELGEKRGGRVPLHRPHTTDYQRRVARLRPGADATPGNRPAMKPAVQGRGKPGSAGVAGKERDQKAIVPKRRATYAIGKFEDVLALQQLQRRIAIQLPPGAEITLTPADEFHVTLCYLPDADSDLEARLARASTQAFEEELEVGVSAVEAFNNDKIAIYAAVKPHAGLVEMQRQICDAFDDSELSPYSLTWIPHITLMYIANAALPAALPQPSGEIPLILNRVEVCVEDFVRLAEIQPGTATPQPKPEALRSRWLERTRAARSIRDVLDDGALPGRIKRTVQEALDLGIHPPAAIIKATSRAIRTGWFDPDSTPDSNPVIRYLAGDSMQPKWEDELGAWERSAQRNFGKARDAFKTDHIPPTQAAAIRERLKAVTPGDRAAIQQVFDEARDALGFKSIDEADMVRWAETLDDDEALRSLADFEEDEEQAAAGTLVDPPES